MEFRFRNLFLILLGLSIAASALPEQAFAQRDRGPRRGPPGQRGPAKEFRGIQIDGKMEKGLFPIESTGVSTEPIVSATNKFLNSLSESQKKKTMFPVDDAEWRMWDNRHMGRRQGVGFDEMSDDQRKLAFEMISSALSARGLKTTQDIMKLNETLAEITGRHREYGQWLYWITVMGEPSTTEPWGWQLDGHHVIINCFILGDQVVMTPVFMGSEPIEAKSGKFKGTIILQPEQDKGLAMIRALDEDQQKIAIVRNEKGNRHNVGEAYRDNIDLNTTGICANKFNEAQRKQFLELIEIYVNNMKAGHAKVKMSQVKAFLDRTYFSWIGDTEDDSVFYYRIQSPVILVEFDHQSHAGMRGIRGPSRDHIHTVVRTPNGNDYGADLLRQHYEKHHPDKSKAESATSGK